MYVYILQIITRHWLPNISAVHLSISSEDFFFPNINNMMVVKSSRFRKDYIVLPKYFRSITLFMKQVLSAIIDSWCGIPMRVCMCTCLADYIYRTFLTFCNQLSNCNLLLGKYTSKTIYGIVSLKTTILKVIYPRFSSHDDDQIFYYMLGGQMRITNASIRKYLKLEISGNFYP